MDFDQIASDLYQEVNAPPEWRDMNREGSVRNAIRDAAFRGEKFAVLSYPCPYYILGSLEKAGFRIEVDASLKFEYRVHFSRQ